MEFFSLTFAEIVAAKETKEREFLPLEFYFSNW